MKTKKTHKLFMFLSSTLALTLLCSCVNGEKKAADGSLSYTYQDVPPETYGGAWKRVWQLSGTYAGDAAVDEMTDKNADNWKEIARTTSDGVFVQKDTTKEARYRFDGILESEWMPVLVDTVITQLNPEGVFKGRRCVIPEGSTLVLGSARATFRCTELIVAGNIVAYPGSSYSGRGAGSVDIVAENITIKGNIHMIGEQGTGGANGTNGQNGREGMGYNCTNGDNGGPGGIGGTILIKAKNKLTLENESTQIIAAGGAGGWGGRAGRGRGSCRDGYAGAQGVEGTIQIICPERRLE